VPRPQATLTSATGGIPTGLQVLWSLGPIAAPASIQAGVGLLFVGPPCVDARVFTGVTFTVSGDLGACTLQFGVVPSEDNPVTNSPLGSCLAGPKCSAPVSAPIGVGTTVVRFTDMTGGVPLATPDPAALNAVQWTLTVPATAGAAGCRASFTISDVAFVADSGDATPPPCPPAPSPCPEGATCGFPNPAPGGCMQRYSCVGGAFLPVPCPL
jgi:hypothetical protein